MPTCEAHNRRYHDFFINYRVRTEGTATLVLILAFLSYFLILELFYITQLLLFFSLLIHLQVSPVKTLYEALSNQNKTKSIDSVTVFWDVKCLKSGQNWERSFFNALTNSKIVILLISKAVCFVFNLIFYNFSHSLPVIGHTQTTSSYSARQRVDRVSSKLIIVSQLL